MRTVEVTDELQEYMDGLLPKRDRVLARMEEEAHRENIPIVDAHEGSLLYLLVKIAGAKRILELGTATGYSGIWLLRGSGGGTLTTYEMDHERVQRARANFAEAGLGKAAIVLEENAKDGLEKLEGRSRVLVYLFVVQGIVSLLLSAIAIGFVLFGPAGERPMAIAWSVIAFGSGCSLLIVAGGMLSLSRSRS